MRYLGRFQLGDEVPAVVQTVDGNTVSSQPVAAPTARIYDSAGALIVNPKIPLADRYGSTNVFSYPIFLDAAYASGDYYIVFRWTVSGTVFQELQVFTVVAGGDAKGQVIAAYAYQRPEATYLVHQLSGGRIHKGRNPRTE